MGEFVQLANGALPLLRVLADSLRFRPDNIVKATLERTDDGSSIINTQGRPADVGERRVGVKNELRGIGFRLNEKTVAGMCPVLLKKRVFLSS